MRVLYHQRSRIPEAEERELKASYVALDVLMSADGVPPLMTKAIAAATRRGKELAG